MTPINVQLVIDVEDPHAQARFWSEALHWPVDDLDPLIRRLLADGVATEDDVMQIDGKYAWVTAATVTAPEGTRSPMRLLFQSVPEHKQVKNRLHLDLNVGPDRRDDEVERLVGLGATVAYRIDEPSSHHVTMRDPEGNEFCVQ